MLYRIKHRLTATTLFEHECDSLKLCVEAAVKACADLRYANLSDAYLRYANLSGADLSGAYLNHANLSGANLSDAYLRYANLSGADLRYANLSGVYHVTGAGYPNGWAAFGWLKDGVIQVRVGCQSFSLAEGRAYWAGKDDRREVLAALDYIESVAKIRNWL